MRSGVAPYMDRNDKAAVKSVFAMLARRGYVTRYAPAYSQIECRALMAGLVEDFTTTPYLYVSGEALAAAYDDAGQLQRFVPLKWGCNADNAHEIVSAFAEAGVGVEWDGDLQWAIFICPASAMED